MQVRIDKNGCLCIAAETEMEYYAMNKWADDNTTESGPNMSFRPKYGGMLAE